MKVLIMYRNSYDGGDGWEYHPLEVDIADTCPICGGPRGKPTGFNHIEDEVSYHLQTWENPCGHVDKYRDVYLEHLKRITPLEEGLSRKLRAEVRKNNRGGFSIHFEDVDDGDTPVGNYPNEIKAQHIAALNGYEVVETLLPNQCGN